MGLFDKIAHARMSDPVEGWLQITGITSPDPTATQTNYRLDGVVTADGMPATPIVHHGFTSVAHWPSPGDRLSVTVDRAKPDRIVIHWPEAGRVVAANAAQELADQLNAGTAAPQADPPVAVPAADPPQSFPDPPRVTAADILAHGTPGRAEVVEAFADGETAPLPDHTMIGLHLHVEVPGHPAYDVQNLYQAPNAKRSALHPGATVPVKVDASNSGMVAVDWDAVGAPT